MRYLLISIAIFCSSVVNITYSQTSWIQQTSGTTKNLNSVYFIDANTGFAAGDSGTILRTTNSGINWTIQQTVNNLVLYSIQFINQNTGFAGGNLQGVTDGIICKTTDGGSNWNLIHTGGSHLPQFVQYFDEQTGYARANAYNLDKTTNSGLNWSTFNISAGDLITGYHFIDVNTGWAAANHRSSSPYNNKIFKTTDGGLNWNLISLNPLPMDINEFHIFFCNNSTGYLCTEFYCKIYKTTNSGVSWSQQFSDTLATKNISFFNQQGGCVVGKRGSIFITTNGGLNWNISNFNNNILYLNNICFVNNDIAFAVGTGGAILKTTNAGLSPVIQVGNQEPNQFSLSQNYPNPFNPSTKIQFALPKSSFASLVIYDVLGREVETIFNEKLNAGTYEEEWNAGNYPSGVYFYKLVVGDNTNNGGFVETKKMILIK